MTERTHPVIFISAGEASGEHYGALLATALSHRFTPKSKPAELIGMGGPRMEAAGVERIVRAEDVAVMGFTEIVLHLPRIYREFQKLKRAIRARKPDIAILIDFPEIHFRLAKEFHRLGIPVIYFVSPQLWAWKQHRIELVRKYVKRMLVIFPFEQPFYRDRGVAAEFVGHPLAELPLPSITRQQFASDNGLDPARTWIALLPGSRPREIADHIPTMLDAARELFASAGTSSNYEFVIPLAATLSAAQRRSVSDLADKYGSGLSVHLISDLRAEGAVCPTAGGDARAALFHARASVVASGTATVEAALIGNPFVVIYRVSPVTYAIAKRVVKVPHVAMANLIAGKRVVPELIQQDFTAANVAKELKRLLPDGPDRQSMIVGLKAVRKALQRQPADAGSEGSGAIERVADVVIEELGATSITAVAASQY